MCPFFSLYGLHLIALIVIQYNVEVTVKNTVNQLYSYSTVLGKAIKCKPYSGIWDTFKNCKNYIEYICCARDCSQLAQAVSAGTAKTHFWLLDGVHSLFALVINVVFQVGMCCSIQQVHTTSTCVVGCKKDG